jgi:hypothetical protein
MVSGELFLFPFGEKGLTMLNYFKYSIVALAVCTVGFFAPEVLAQTNTVSYEPIVEFGSLFDTIRTALGPIVVGALGLGLAIWGARYVFGVIKSMGR